MKRFFWALGITVALASLAVFLLYRGQLRFNYPGPGAYPVRGIDISHHQGAIDWQALSEEKIHFVFIKATEGGDFVDPKFAQNWHRSLKQGYRTGAYHFFRSCKTGQEQADNFIRQVPVHEGTLPPVIDLEFGGNCRTSLTEAEQIQNIQTCLDRLEQHYGKRPILYVTGEFYEALVRQRFLSYPIWIRDIYTTPKLEHDRSWTFWQYANRGHLSGIDGYVDLNVFAGSADDFERFVRTEPHR